MKKPLHNTTPQRKTVSIHYHWISQQAANMKYLIVDLKCQTHCSICEPLAIKMSLLANS